MPEGERKYQDKDTFKDTTDRFLQDAEFREFGFCIHSRPTNGEAVWERDGQLYHESSVRSQIRRMKARTEHAGLSR